MNIRDLNPNSYNVVQRPQTLNINNLPQGSYGIVSQINQSIENKPFTFDVQQSTLQRTPAINTQIKARMDASYQKSKKESDYANSPIGFAKNFLQSAGSQIASSEIGLGQTLGKAFGNPTLLKEHANTVNRLTNDNIRILRTIKDQEAKGIDTTKLKQIYNSNVKMIGGSNQEINQLNQELPTNAQALGQVGGTALDALTAGTYGTAAQGLKSFQLGGRTSAVKNVATAVSPELGKLSEQTASGLFTRTGAKNILRGTGIGYGYDVSQNLQAGKEGGEALKPGIGTLVGAGLPAISETAKSISNRFSTEGRTATETARVNKLINKKAQEILKIENNYAPLRKNKLFSKDANSSSRQRIAASDVLNDSINVDGKIDTLQPGGAVDTYKAATIGKGERYVRDGLEREGNTISLLDVQKALTDKVNKSGLEGAELRTALNGVKKEISGYRLRTDSSGRVPATILHDAKVSKNNSINWQTPPNDRKYATAIQQGLKKIIEDNTSTFDVKKINTELGKYLQDIKLLESLDGRLVKGGKLGKYFAEGAGHVVGGVAGSIVGGPLGAVIGYVGGGELAGRIKGKQMSSIFKGDVGRGIPQSKILQEQSNLNKSPRPMLPAPKPGAYPKEYGATGPTISLPSAMPRDQAIIDALYGQKKSGDQSMRSSLARTSVTTASNTINKSKPISQSMAQIGEKVKGKTISIFKKTKAGASIKDVSKKGSQAMGQIAKENPLLQEARKYKSAEEFMKAQTTIHRGDTTPIKLSEMDTTKVFNHAEKEALSAFNNTPGLYFTDSVSNAKSYGKNLTSVSFEPSAKVINVNDAPKILKRSDVEKIIRSNPRIKDWATNWSENFDQAIKQITDSVISERDGNEFLKAIWSDGGFSEGDFVNAMKKAGLDGIRVQKEGVNHFVIYNKDILKTKSQLTDIWKEANNKTLFPKTDNKK